ncbi:MAG: hypothetical protein IH941_03800 [Acidobacteria bacterium]|nr:hypothetical protein [Acidobacteriota bacterium]
MSWINAFVRGLLIVAYFVVATIIVPNAVLRLDSVSAASNVVRDMVVLAVWGVGLAGGLWVLRRAQRRGLI